MDRHTPEIWCLGSVAGAVPRQVGQAAGRPTYPGHPPQANPSYEARAGPLQAPRGPLAKHPAHNHPQVMTCHLHQVTLADLPQAPQPTPPRAAGLTDVSERPLHVLASLPLQPLAAWAVAASSVVPIRLLPGRRLIGPHTALPPPLLS